MHCIAKFANWDVRLTKERLPQFKDKGVGFDGFPMAVEEDVRTLPADAHLGHLGHQGGAAHVHSDQEGY